MEELLTGKAATKSVVADGPARLLELTVEAAEDVFGCSFAEMVLKRKEESGPSADQVKFQVCLNICMRHDPPEHSRMMHHCIP